MANLPAVRMLIVVVSVSLLASFPRIGSAQILPYSPISPTEPKQCQDFSKGVDAYEADYQDQHQKCLDNKLFPNDHPNEPKDSGICVKSVCQYLHDMIYSDMYSSVKSLRKEVAACYDNLKAYQARKAQEEKDEKAQQEDADKAEDIKKGIDAVARRNADKDSKDSASKKSAADQPAANVAAAENVDPAYPLSTRQSPTTPTSNQSSSNSSRLVNPFKNSDSASAKQEIASNAGLVDPFSSKEKATAVPATKLIDPFEASTLNTSWESHLKRRLVEFLSCKEQIDDSSPCNRFVGKALADVYGIDDFKDPTNPGQYISANMIEAFVDTHPKEWIKLGNANNQQVLDQAAAFANQGRAVIAVKEGERHGHVAIVLPGRESDPLNKNWPVKQAPNSAAFFQGKPKEAYVGKPLSKAFTTPDSVTLFAHEE